MTDLASWVLAQIDADEQLARRVEEQVGAARAGEQFPDRSRIADYDDFPSYPWSLEHQAPRPGRQWADHRTAINGGAVANPLWGAVAGRAAPVRSWRSSTDRVYRTHAP